MRLRLDSELAKERHAYQCEQHEKSCDVAEHATERDLQRAEHLEGRHQIRRTGDTQNVGDGEQHVGNDFGIVGFPVESNCEQRKCKEKLLPEVIIGL
jgi:hypothetical protein